MDEDKASRFISSLVKSIQALCNGFVDFSTSIEVIGHIHLNIDRSVKLDYVLTEEVSKSVSEGSTVFSSHSYHSQAPPSVASKSASDTLSHGQKLRKDNDADPLGLSALAREVPNTSKLDSHSQSSNRVGDSSNSSHTFSGSGGFSRNSDSELLKHENNRSLCQLEDSSNKRRKMGPLSQTTPSPAAKRSRSNDFGSGSRTVVKESGFEVIEIKEEPDDDDPAVFFGNSGSGQDIHTPDFSNVVMESLDRVNQLEQNTDLVGDGEGMGGPQQPVFPVMFHQSDGMPSSSAGPVPGPSSDPQSVASTSGDAPNVSETGESKGDQPKSPPTASTQDDQPTTITPTTTAATTTTSDTTSSSPTPSTTTPSPTPTTTTSTPTPTPTSPTPNTTSTPTPTPTTTSSPTPTPTTTTALTSNTTTTPTPATTSSPTSTPAPSFPASIPTPTPTSVAPSTDTQTDPTPTTATPTTPSAANATTTTATTLTTIINPTGTTTPSPTAPTTTNPTPTPAGSSGAGSSGTSQPLLPYTIPPRPHISIPPMSPKFKPEDLPPDTKPEDVARLTERHVLERVPPTERKKYPSKRCKVCLRRSGYGPGPARKHPKESVYYCPQCPSKPGLCCYPCYYVYHSKLNFWELDEGEEQTGGTSSGGAGGSGGGSGGGGGGSHAGRYPDSGARGYGPGGGGMGIHGGLSHGGLHTAMSGGSYSGASALAQAAHAIGRAMQLDSSALYGSGAMIDVEEEQEHKYCPVPMYGESLYGPGGQ